MTVAMIVGMMPLGAISAIAATGMNIQVASLDTGSGITIAAGNSKNRKVVTKRIEGTGAYYSDWDDVIGNSSKLYFNIYDFLKNRSVDLTGGKYLTFDIYCHGWEYKTSGGESIWKVGTNNAWNPTGAYELGSGENALKTAAAGFHEGWNHVLMDISVKDDGVTPVSLAECNTISLQFEQSINVSSTDGRE